MVWLLKWSAFLSVSAAVLYGLFRPAPPEIIFEHSDKVGHIIAFLALTITSRIVFITPPQRVFWSSMFLLAFLLEYLQGQFRPLRLFSFEDAYANALGVSLALAILKYKNYRNKCIS